MTFRVVLLEELSWNGRRVGWLRTARLRPARQDFCSIYCFVFPKKQCIVFVQGAFFDWSALKNDQVSEFLKGHNFVSIYNRFLRILPKAEYCSSFHCVCCCPSVYRRGISQYIWHKYHMNTK